MVSGSHAGRAKLHGEQDGVKSGPKSARECEIEGGAVRFPIALIVALITAIIGSARASGQVSDDIVRIGVLNDQSGLYADLGGPGSVVAARMAIEDTGGAVLGKPVEVVFGDHQNKPDIGAAIARHWFDAEKVDMAIGFDNAWEIVPACGPSRFGIRIACWPSEASR